MATSYGPRPERSNAYFTIERSHDGIVFDSILSVAGAGDSRSLLNYSAVDFHPLLHVSYYRLKQTDYDQHAGYSEVVRIDNIGSGKMQLEIYPNPSQNPIHCISGSFTAKRMWPSW